MSDHDLKVHSRLSGEKGATLVVVAISLFMLVAFIALAVDLGYLFVGRNELQNAADAAALGATRQLGAIYQGMPPEDQSSYNVQTDKVTIINSAKDVALLNKATRQGIVIADTNILIGKWDPDNPGPSDAFTETNLQPNAVKVKAIRDSSNVSGRISTFFAGIFGIDAVTVAAEAVAALSGPAWVDEGELKTPFGLSENVFPNDCSDVINFSPTTSSCAGWHNFLDPINANAMEDKLLGFIQGDSDCQHCGGTLSNGPDWLSTNFDINVNQTPDPAVTPATSAGEEFEFQGGTISSLFNGGYLGSDYNGNTGTVYDNEKKPAPIIALFDYFRYRDGDGDDSVWTATIPVYKDLPDTCMNPNDSLEIVGYARIVVMSPDPPPLSNIQVHVDCNFTVIEARGGGGTYGNVVGSIPNLVK